MVYLLPKSVSSTSWQRNHHLKRRQFQCKLLIHKKCHKLLRVVCDASQVASLPKQLPQQPESGATATGNGGDATSQLCHLKDSEAAGEQQEISPIEEVRYILDKDGDG